jgi:hypothetical protein
LLIAGPPAPLQTHQETDGQRDGKAAEYFVVIHAVVECWYSAVGRSYILRRNLPVGDALLRRLAVIPAERPASARSASYGEVGVTPKRVSA